MPGQATRTCVKTFRVCMGHVHSSSKKDQYDNVCLAWHEKLLMSWPARLTFLYGTLWSQDLTGHASQPESTREVSIRSLSSFFIEGLKHFLKERKTGYVNQSVLEASRTPKLSASQSSCPQQAVRSWLDVEIQLHAEFLQLTQEPQLLSPHV